MDQAPDAKEAAVLFSSPCALWKNRYPTPGTVALTAELLSFRATLRGSDKSADVKVADVATWETQTTLAATWLVVRHGAEELCLLMTSASCAALDAVLRRLREETTRRNLEISEKIRSAPPEAAHSVAAVATGGKDEVTAVSFRLPAGQTVIEKPDVWLFEKRQRSYCAGKLCLFADFVGFWSENLWVAIPLAAVTFVIPSKTLMVMNNALQLITNTASFFFVAAKDRDALLHQIVAAWKLAKARVDAAPYPTVTSRGNEQPTRSDGNLMQLAMMDSYVAQWGSGVCMMRSYPQLRFLCQSGIPDRHRASMWQSCSGEKKLLSFVFVSLLFL